MLWPDPANGSPTEANGLFRADRLAPGAHSVRVQAEDHIAERLETIPAGTTDLVVTLRRGRAISGHVRRPDGSPAVGLTVSLTDADGPGRRSAQTDQDGGFRIGGLKDGLFDLRVRAKGVPGAPDLTRNGIASGTADLVLQLEAGLSISGVVVDERGVGIADARIRAYGWADGRSRGGAPSGDARTDESGRFEVDRLDAGGYRVRVSGWVTRPAADGSTVRLDASPLETIGGSSGLRIVMKVKR